MNTVLLIFLSLFATIGLAFIVDSFVKHLTYQPMSVEDMELRIYLSGDAQGLTDMINVLSDDLFFYRTQKGSATLHIINGGLSKENIESIRMISKTRDNIKFTEDIIG